MIPDFSPNVLKLEYTDIIVSLFRPSSGANYCDERVSMSVCMPTHVHACLLGYLNKCSAVDEMGDRLVTIDMARNLGAVPLFFGGGELGPHLTQCGLGQGLPSYQVTS